MSPVAWAVALVAAQRLVELAVSARNTRRLLAQGATEHGARHYPLLVLLHASWLASLLLAVPAERMVWWPAALLYLALQPVRLWAMLSLGGRWTTRVLILPGAPLVRRGPYRYLRHPNYAVVAAEIAILPAAFGAWALAVAFSLLNGLLLWWRIRTEDAALRPPNAGNAKVCGVGRVFDGESGP